MSMLLRPYKPSDATAITSWIKDEFHLRQWSADRFPNYPVSPNDMNLYYREFIDGKNSVALTLCDDNEVVGYITLRIPGDDLSERRLGFVIVDDSKRRKGLGKTLVKMAVDYAFRELGASKVSLGVFENNHSAIHCYTAAGFHRVSVPKRESYECLGEKWECIEMKRYSWGTIRLIKPNEIPLLTDFLYEAIYKPGDYPKVPRTVLQEPMVWAYVDNFGSLSDDVCHIAIVDDLIVGAIWSRLGCSYGKLDDSTPELAISLYPQYRGRGIGNQLLSCHLAHLKEKGYKQITLSVDKTNYAVKMYVKAGFNNIMDREHDYLMIYDFAK